MNRGELVLSEIKQSDDLSGSCCGDADLDEFLESIDFYIKHTHKSEKQIYPTLYLNLLRIE
ncbi:MAG: hypothetical protein NTW48_08930 [Chloroflexi bacterium]|nr:hypothetical protein [Chloroflexota bacterium]